MGWVIAVVVISMVLAPLMWIMPTPTQKRQARMREAARQCGLQVRIGPLPQTRRDKVRRQPEETGVSYIRQHPRSRTQWPRWIAWREVPEGESRLPERLAPEQRQLLQDILEQLPADAVAVECNQQGLIVYWRERGDEATVRQLAQLLERMAQSIGAENGDD